MLGGLQRAVVIAKRECTRAEKPARLRREGRRTIARASGLFCVGTGRNPARAPGPRPDVDVVKDPQGLAPRHASERVRVHPTRSVSTPSQGSPRAGRSCRGPRAAQFGFSFRSAPARLTPPLARTTSEGLSRGSIPRPPLRGPRKRFAAAAALAMHEGRIRLTGMRLAREIAAATALDTAGNCFSFCARAPAGARGGRGPSATRRGARGGARFSKDHYVRSFPSARPAGPAAADAERLETALRRARRPGLATLEQPTKRNPRRGGAWRRADSPRSATTRQLRRSQAAASPSARPREPTKGTKRQGRGTRFFKQTALMIAHMGLNVRLASLENVRAGAEVTNASR